MNGLFERLMDGEIKRAEDRLKHLVDRLADETQWAHQALSAGRGMSTGTWLATVEEIRHLDDLLVRLTDLRDAHKADLEVAADG